MMRWRQFAKNTAWWVREVDRGRVFPPGTLRWFLLDVKTLFRP